MNSWIVYNFIGRSFVAKFVLIILKSIIIFEISFQILVKIHTYTYVELSEVYTAQWCV